RVEDIPLLAQHFLALYWERHRTMGDPMPTLTESAVEFLRSRPWNGNVRELQNVIEHMAVLAEPGQTIRPEEIPFYDDTPRQQLGGSAYPSTILNDGFHNAKEQLIAHFEREYLTRLVARADGNMSKAARLANVDRTTLYRLMEKHSFRRDELSHTVHPD